MLLAIIYMIVGIGVVVAGIVHIGRNRRRFIGSLTIFVGLNVVLFGYALLRGIDDAAGTPPHEIATPTGPPASPAPST
jgi:hypothetical protein